jgi:hypothetical protein
MQRNTSREDWLIQVFVIASMVAAVSAVLIPSVRESIAAFIQEEPFLAVLLLLLAN